MLGSEWATHGSEWRVIIFAVFWGCIIIMPIGIALYYGVEKPQDEHWAQVVADDKSKSQAEHDKIIAMDCKALGGWLTQDSWFDRDNLIWAQNHYLVNCK